MKFHQAGKLIIFVSFVTIALTTLFYVLLLANLWWVNLIFFTIMLALGILILRFFRVVGTSLREVKTALLNNWQGCMMTKNGFLPSSSPHAPHCSSPSCSRLPHWWGYVVDADSSDLRSCPLHI